MSVNLVAFTGNIGANAELRCTKSGSPVCTFSLAVNDRTPKADGTWGEHTNWLDCAMFGKRAEAIAPYLTKGSKVAVSGKVKTHTFQKDGQNIKRWEIRVENVEFMSVNRERQAAKPSDDQAMPDVYDEDIPF